MLHLQTALAFPPMRPSAAAGLTARHAPKSLAPPNMGEAEPARLSEGVEPQMAKVHIADMADSSEQPIMEPSRIKLERAGMWSLDTIKVTSDVSMALAARMTLWIG